MYHLLTNQFKIILPHKDSTTKRFMWNQLMGLKRFLTKDLDCQTGLLYKEHCPGFVIKENGIKYWVDHLDSFKGWELFVPDTYVAKIKDLSKIDDIEDRTYVSFDTKYLLSVFRSLNETQYQIHLHEKFTLREKRLKKTAEVPPLMIQSFFINKIQSLY